MRKELAVCHASQERIYTLAQSGTGKAVKNDRKPQIIVSGEGSELSNTKALLGKAKRKMITQATALSLVDVVMMKGEPERKQAYWNTYHCQNKLYTAKGRIYGKSCKNRNCTSCCANRKAEIMNKYLPEIKTWKDPFFVTLTAKAVKAKELKQRVNKMVKAFRIIKDRFKKRHQRGKGLKLIGIKSLECNFNPATKTYNPHFHLIVPSRELAYQLMGEWLALWTDNNNPKHRKWASPKGQKRIMIRDSEKYLIEVVKYGSKIFTEPDVDNKARKKVPPHIYVAALDNILCAMKRHRIFERFGFNLPTPKQQEREKFKLLTDYKEWEYKPKKADWVNPESEKVLTEYLPPTKLTSLLEDNINITLE